MADLVGGRGGARGHAMGPVFMVLSIGKAAPIDTGIMTGGVGITVGITAGGDRLGLATHLR